MQTADDQTFQQLVIQRSHQLPVLVDFWATWCGPCKALAPLLQQLALQLSPLVEVVKVDIDGAPFTATHYQVTSIPTLLLFRAGVPTARLVGNPGSLVMIIQRLGLTA